MLQDTFAQGLAHIRKFPISRFHQISFWEKMRKYLGVTEPDKRALSGSSDPPEFLQCYFSSHLGKIQLRVRRRTIMPQLLERQPQFWEKLLGYRVTRPSAQKHEACSGQINSTGQWVSLLDPNPGDASQP